MMKLNSLQSVAWLSCQSKLKLMVFNWFNNTHKTLGPAPKADFEGDDIIDEAINQFRANILFKNYDVRGPADKTLIYLTVFIQKVLETVAKK